MRRIFRRKYLMFTVKIFGNASDNYLRDIKEDFFQSFWCRGQELTCSLEIINSENATDYQPVFYVEENYFPFVSYRNGHEIISFEWISAIYPDLKNL